jgi:5-methylcytosine-specific restriction protein B
MPIRSCSTFDRRPALGPWLDALKERIRAHIGRDARNLQIGHAYFLEGDKPINDKWKVHPNLREDILPYWKSTATKIMTRWVAF